MAYEGCVVYRFACCVLSNYLSPWFGEGKKSYKSKQLKNIDLIL